MELVSCGQLTFSRSAEKSTERRNVLSDLFRRRSAIGDSKLQVELTYLVIFFLVGVFVVLTAIRLIRAAGSTISQLRHESERDRRQHRRIAEEKYRQFVALREGSRKINGKATRIRWDESGRRAHREFHVDGAVDEVFDDTNEFRNMDVRTPWGWPSASGKRISPAGRRRRPPLSVRMRNAAVALFRNKQVIDDEYRARVQRNIRALIEDRYGRAGHGHLPASEIEWSKPQLPAELIRERQADQMHVKRESDPSDAQQRTIRALQLVSETKKDTGTKRKAAG